MEPAAGVAFAVSPAVTPFTAQPESGLAGVAEVMACRFEAHALAGSVGTTDAH